VQGGECTRRRDFEDRATRAGVVATSTVAVAETSGVRRPVEVSIDWRNAKANPCASRRLPTVWPIKVGAAEERRRIGADGTSSQSVGGNRSGSEAGSGHWVVGAVAQSSSESWPHFAGFGLDNRAGSPPDGDGAGWHGFVRSQQHCTKTLSAIGITRRKNKTTYPLQD
jgi:hypothetical protein